MGIELHIRELFELSWIIMVDNKLSILINLQRSFEDRCSYNFDIRCY